MVKTQVKGINSMDQEMENLRRSDPWELVTPPANCGFISVKR